MITFPKCLRRICYRRRKTVFLVLVFAYIVIVVISFYYTPLELDVTLSDTATTVHDPSLMIPQLNRLTYNTEKESRLPFLYRNETAVNMSEFYHCMAQRLAVDLDTRTQKELIALETIPMMVFPFMMEVADLRALMCSVRPTVRYFVFVVNGGVPEVQDFFNDLEMVFGWTGRLTVKRNYENEGFSACVNTGIAAALMRPIDEVPFIFVSNIDVRYIVEGVDVLSHRIRQFHALIAKDGERIALLQAEVQAEASSMVMDENRTLLLRGAWCSNCTLVTSALLPARIRAMPAWEQRQAFMGHYGWLSLHHKEWHGSVFGLSRLAMLTVGYWDENFYPAYSEDFDYFWRVRKLGFRFYKTNRKRWPEVTHYRNAMTKTSTAYVGGQRGPLRLLSRRAVQMLREFAVFMRDYKVMRNNYRYIGLKWGMSGPRGNLSTQYHILFEGLASKGLSLPVDAWVRDVDYAKRILACNRAGGACVAPDYNVDLIRVAKESRSY